MAKTGSDQIKGLGPAQGYLECLAVDLASSMECGQVFGWHKHDGSYYGIVKGAAVRLWQEGPGVGFEVEGGLESVHIAHYLGLDEDLDVILESIAVDPVIRRIISKVRGLRLLKQDPWHCLCSYLLSSNNNVARIDGLVKELGRKFGEAHCVGGRTVYSLPPPADLAQCAETGIRACGTGFRAPYLLGAARMVAGATVNLERLGRLPYQRGKEILRSLPGVGDKIADCVLLFAFSKYEAFPVDVWIRRAMQKIYFDSREVKPEEIRRFGQRHFGRYAGYAQEYIYHYARHYGLD